VSPILFTVYVSGQFSYVEEKVPNIKALSFVDDVAWTAVGDEEDDLSETLERAATAAQEWADINAVTFDTERMEAILLSRRRKRKSLAPHHEGSRLGTKWSSSMRRRPGGSASGSALSWR